LLPQYFVGPIASAKRRRAQAGITRLRYQAAKAGDCPTTTPAVVVEGKRAGTKLYVCTNPKCKVHSARSVSLTPEEKAARKKQAHEQSIQQEYRKRLLTEVFKRVPGELGRHELDLIATSHFQQLGHDSQHRLFKFFAWETVAPVSDRRNGKDRNGGPERRPTGGYTDYPKLATAKLDKMTTAKIGKFLVVCALAADLYFPTYHGSTSSKDTKLIKEAAHYRVNFERVLREVREKLAPKHRKPKPEPQSSAKTDGIRKPK